MKISQLFLGLVACSTAFAYAGIDGISSNESNIKIGAAANASHPGGVAAVSVQAAGAPYNAFTGFSSLLCTRQISQNPYPIRVLPS